MPHSPISFSMGCETIDLQPALYSMGTFKPADRQPTISEDLRSNCFDLKLFLKSTSIYNLCIYTAEVYSNALQFLKHRVSREILD
jgi:hypothetical protein